MEFLKFLPTRQALFSLSNKRIKGIDKPNKRWYHRVTNTRINFLAAGIIISNAD